MLSVYAALAEKTYRKRWQYGQLALLSLIVAIPVAFVSGFLWKPLFAVLLPVGVAIHLILWGIVMTAFWFHPTNGHLSANSFVGRLPTPISWPVRVLYAAFLSLWFLLAVGVLVAGPFFLLGRAWV